MDPSYQPPAVDEGKRDAGGPSSAGAGPRPRRGPKPTGVSRAKQWTMDVENVFRLQNMGWKDIYEYMTVNDVPETWPNNLYRKLYQKDTGYISYWRETRELEDAKLHLIKVYKYATPETA